MKKHIQFIGQAVFFVLFIFLMIIGKVQLWMGLFLISVLAALVFGRVYCGWICPINTVMKVITWIKKKLRIKNARIPLWLTKPWIRLFVLGLFAALFAFVMVSGKKLPVLPALLAIGGALTFFFPEELWHRYLCPYGTILSIPARKSKHTMTLDSELCNSCGMCQRVCPAKAVEKRELHYEILKKDCIVCMECSGICKKNAIAYR